MPAVLPAVLGTALEVGTPPEATVVTGTTPSCRGQRKGRRRVRPARRRQRERGTATGAEGRTPANATVGAPSGWTALRPGWPSNRAGCSQEPRRSGGPSDRRKPCARSALPWKVSPDCEPVNLKYDPLPSITRLNSAAMPPTQFVTVTDSALPLWGDDVARLMCSSVRLGSTFTLTPNETPLLQPGKVAVTSSYCHEPYGRRMLLRAAPLGTVTVNWNEPPARQATHRLALLGSARCWRRCRPGSPGTAGQRRRVPTRSPSPTYSVWRPSGTPA